MRTSRFLAVGSVCLVLTLIAFAAWAAPPYVSYQGQLLDQATGDPLNGTFDMEFRVYDAASGGTYLWSQTHTDVYIKDGVFNVTLGPVNPDDFLLDNRWIEVWVEGEPFSPRQQCTSVLFAINADRLDGLDSGDFAGSSHEHSFGEITGTATDAQIPNNITIDHSTTSTSANYANEAGNADTLDGKDASAFAGAAHTHGFSQLTGTATDAQIPNNITINYAASAGNADTLDGLHAGSFLSTSSDYGRSGVSSNLYEGAETLSARYLNDDRAETLRANTSTTLFSVIQDGTGWGINAETDGAIAVRGRSNDANGAGIAGYGFGTNGVGVFGQGAGWAGYFVGPSKFEVGGGSIAVSTPGGWPGVIAYSPNGHRRDIQYYNDFMAITMSDTSSPSPSTNGIRIYESGNVAVKVIQITGGSDLSEQFDIRSLDEDFMPSPGMVVSIDPTQPGDLVISQEPYDKRVAGIISGAGGVKPGMLMGQKDSEADGANPVALTGRVYCWADASQGSIEPGDLLTTSGSPGHAMKVLDYTKAQGAVIGKAMSSLKEGRGLILVLVTLQ